MNQPAPLKFAYVQWGDEFYRLKAHVSDTEAERGRCVERREKRKDLKRRKKKKPNQSISDEFVI